MEPDIISLNTSGQTLAAKRDEHAAGARDGAQMSANPFVGLRSFGSDEGQLFFGRHEQTIELLQQLHRTRFLSVVGSSGCGKSSLIRAGLVPQLKAGFLREDRDQWCMATMKPGDAPLSNLALTMLGAFMDEPPPPAEAVAALVEEVRLTGVQALIERLRPRLEKSDTNFLLLVDQFEEIFRFGSYADDESPAADEAVDPAKQRDEANERECRRDEAADFVSIMLALAQQQALPIYVVMTMRSDFLGDCDAFYGLPQAMNRSQYLVPRLTRQQRHEAIENPIRLYGATITEQLLDRLLNDVGDESDQLPVMQHALLRTWEAWQREGRTGPIDVTHYNAIGTIKEALSRDADKALEGMSKRDLTLTKRLFQTLTDVDAKGRRLRRPAHFSEIQAITDASLKEIFAIVERFRSDGRSFLTLTEEPIEDDPLIDISHESLIRQWKTLREWVDAEAVSREIYTRLAGAALRYYSPKQMEGLWTDPALQVAIDWREKRRPNKAWAQRYHPAYAEAMNFLDESLTKRTEDAVIAERRRELDALREREEFEKAKIFAEQQQHIAELKKRQAEELAAARQSELEAEQRLSGQRLKDARRLRQYTWGLLAFSVIAMFAAVIAFYAWQKAKASEREANVAKGRLEESLIAELQAKSEAERLAVTLEASLQGERMAKEEAEGQRGIAQAKAEEAGKAQALAEAATKRAREQASKATTANNRMLAVQSANQMRRDATKLIDAAKTEEAHGKFKEAIEGYKKIPDFDGVATTYVELGKMLLGDSKAYEREISEQDKQGLGYFNEAIKVYQDHPDMDGFTNSSASTYIKIGEFYYRKATYIGSSDDERKRELEQRVGEALKNYEMALSDYRKAQNDEGKILALTKSGDLLVGKSDDMFFDDDDVTVDKTEAGKKKTLKAIGYYEQTVPLYQELIRQQPPAGKQKEKLQDEYVSMLLRVGRFYENLNDDAAASRHQEMALDVYRNPPDPQKEVEILIKIGSQVKKGKARDDYFQRAVQVYRQAGKAKEEAETLQKIGQSYRNSAYMSDDKVAKVEEQRIATLYYQQALAIYKGLGEVDKQAEVYAEMAVSHYRMGEKEETLNHLRSALALYEQSNNIKKQAEMHGDIGYVLGEMNNMEPAIKSLEKAISLYRQANDTATANRTQRDLDDLKNKKNQPPKP